MKYFALSIFLGIFAMLSCSYMSSSVRRSEIFARASRSAVIVDHAYGQGSGTIVGTWDKYSLILTCAHVVAECDQSTLKVMTYSAAGDVNSYPASIDMMDESRDLALLAVMGMTTGEPLAVAKVEPAIFDTVYLMGAPFGHPHTASEGIISSKDDLIRPSGPNWRITGGYISSGISGGSIVNGNAELVCVPEAVYVHDDVKQPQVGSCIPLGDIRRVLTPYKVL